MENDPLKELFLDNNIRLGGFFELSIQTIPDINIDSIRIYGEHIWKLGKIDGPYDSMFAKSNFNAKDDCHEGILHLESHSIPFISYGIRCDKSNPLDADWFDICFYTSTIEKVFGKEYCTWSEHPNIPTEISQFFSETAKYLYQLQPFQMAISGFEVSGSCSLPELISTPFDFSNCNLYIGREQAELINKYENIRTRIIHV